MRIFINECGNAHFVNMSSNAYFHFVNKRSNAHLANKPGSDHFANTISMSGNLKPLNNSLWVNLAQIKTLKSFF